GRHDPVVLVDGQDVTQQIRTPEVNAAVSVVAGFTTVREEMVARQRQIAAGGAVVMDGRDIGTHVLPMADVKFFLTASLQERAKRRWEELKSRGYHIDLDVLTQEIAHRDQLDSQRAFAPLRQAEDAVLLDTTNMEVDHVVKEMLDIFYSHGV
ncbi:MAG: (d)CMP kinase, partial [Firmicutes bacterium]|nr:(d)CMP kinase [Bacillota bacterium]